MSRTPLTRVAVPIRARVAHLGSLLRPDRRNQIEHARPRSAAPTDLHGGRREFRDYFVTHLPSSSLHPDPRSAFSSFHKLPRADSVPHTGDTPRTPATFQTLVNRETTVVRIPLRNAKHHFGASTARGTRPTNEDTWQAGVLDIPAFAKRPPPPGDPQVFYFGIFDGHGGTDCSTYLQQQLHEYIQNTAAAVELQSSLPRDACLRDSGPGTGDRPIVQGGNTARAAELERRLVQRWRSLVGGYFRRYVPAHFAHLADPAAGSGAADRTHGVTIEEILEYAFLRADLEFVAAQAARQTDDELAQVGRPVAQDQILYGPRHPRVTGDGARGRFKGGSTASVALISTPTPTPFWHPDSAASLLVSHVGDTRMLLSSTVTGEAVALTTDHHPSAPVEATRLRRYAATFVTDSFGEERISGLANTRAFGDVQSKRIGVSAEPEIRRVEMAPAEYAFLVLVSDGVSGTLSDQEVVDIVKEAKTPEAGARAVVDLATEVSREGDNATCLVVRLGGWERRQEGGVGSLGTKETRDWRRQEATDPRRSRR
ncbi:protein serine/threonine phosphatase 2C [Aspergillus campestris IBT 28561]|uniref:Protein serine/threonine phosphatase 2C n=1 Tax=Aspergillus campestris (strain IBT 28561) TaxID=1392248 RepID=A0A2I1D3R7_ASPC2|nr:protein serine/threonine phosphatase 2C [Aspergillus campestris IBT 28561]PKY04515.1 protein serine/threonine phosphatase 2C [Aspergillus campestris IBT 28561]